MTPDELAQLGVPDRIDRNTLRAVEFSDEAPGGLRFLKVRSPVSPRRFE